MIVDLKKILKGLLIILSIVLPVIFTHQSAVFLDRAARDIRRGQNGLSKGLALLMTGVILGASVSTVDGITRIIKRENILLYNLIARAIGYSLMVPAMHMINNEVNKEE